MLHNKALLVTLSLSMYSPKKTDKRITQKVLAEHGAASGTLRVAKSLLPDDAVEPIRKLHTEIREYHYKHTVAWGDDNERLIASAYYLEYQEKMRQFRAECDKLAETFVQNYPTYVEEARRQLNGAFNPEDYPSQSQIRNKFKFRLDFKPIPDGSDFRISMIREEMDALRDSVESRVQEACEHARADVARRLAEPLQAMVARLSDPDAIFRDSLIGNMREICDLFPKLNITGDTHLESVYQMIRQELYQSDPNTLRNDPAIRSATARKTQAILDHMQGYMAWQMAA